MKDDENELKDIRTNIVAWYPFESKDRILNISDLDEINTYLNSKGYNVDIEPNR